MSRATASEAGAAAAAEVSHSRARALAPEKPNSSLTVAENTTVARRSCSVPRSDSRAAIIAAIPPFTSQAPRPYMRPSRTSGVKGSTAMPSAGTVSWWASQRRIGASGTVASNRTTTLSRPGVTGCRAQVRPAAVNRWTSQSVTRPSRNSGPDTSRPIGLTLGRRIRSARIATWSAMPSTLAEAAAVVLFADARRGRISPSGGRYP